MNHPSKTLVSIQNFQERTKRKFQQKTQSLLKWFSRFKQQCVPSRNKQQP
jgi:hypothetical protein